MTPYRRWTCFTSGAGCDGNGMHGRIIIIITIIIIIIMIQQQQQLLLLIILLLIIMYSMHASMV